jgi:hypothetical protein
MAFSKLEKAMAAVIGLDIARPGTSRAAAKAAVRQVGTLAFGAGGAATGAAARGGLGLTRAAVSAGGLPIGLGVATGLSILGSPEGQEALAAAEAQGRRDRIRFDQFLQDTSIPERVQSTKKKVSKFSKSVKAGMAAAKASTSYGKKGTINNAKKAFAAVTKTASKINKGGKVAKKGALRKIGLAIKKVLR